MKGVRCGRLSSSEVRNCATNAACEGRNDTILIAQKIEKQRKKRGTKQPADGLEFLIWS